MALRPTFVGALATLVAASLLDTVALAQAQPVPPPPVSPPGLAQPIPPPPPAPPPPPPPVQPPAPPQPPPGLVPLSAPPGTHSGTAPVPPYQAPPPGGWQPAPPMAGPVPAEQPPAPAVEPSPKIDGVTAKGLPFSMRGGLIADFAALRVPGAQGPIAAIDVIAHVPVTDHVFVDGVIPIGFGAIGNPMVGVHGVLRPGEKVWFSLGGAFGVPLANVGQFQSFPAARALWDLEEFGPFLVPFALRAGFEAHAGIAEFRVQLEPVWGVSVDTTRADHYFALQHAFEVQIGHAIGGGVRYQGVLIGTNTLSTVDFNTGTTSFDHYQGALELFFRVVHDPIFARMGLLIPIDDPLGSVTTGFSTPSGRTWGVRAQMGFNLD